MPISMQTTKPIVNSSIIFYFLSSSYLMQEACQKIDDMRNVLFINTLINDVQLDLRFQASQFDKLRLLL